MKMKSIVNIQFYFFLCMVDIPWCFLFERCEMPRSSSHHQKRQNDQKIVDRKMAV